MKVQRYTKGATNVAELQSQAAAVISPEEAAAAAAAPYKAVGDAAGAISDDLIRVDQNNKRLMAEEDAINLKLAGEEFKLKASAIENDPANQNQMQSESFDMTSDTGQTVAGNTTAAKMLEDYEQVASEYMESLQGIQNTTTRTNAQKIGELAIQSGRLEMRKMVNKKREGWNAQGLFDLREVQFETQDWTAYRQTNQELRDKDLISEPQFKSATKAGELKQKQVKVDERVATYEQQISIGEGDKALADVMSNPDSDPDIQAATIAGVKGLIVNYGVINKEVEDSRTAQWMRETQNLITSLEDPNVQVDVDSFYKTMLGTDLNPIKAATLAGQVEAAQRNRTTKADADAVFMDELNAGYEFDDNQANRKGTDNYLHRQYKAAAKDPELQGLDPREVEISTYRTTGLVGQRRQTEMQNSSTPENVADQAEFWTALHKDSYIQVEDGLSSDKRSLYERIATRASNGAMSWGEAAKTVLEKQNVDGIKYDLRKEKWVADDGVMKASRFYVDLFDKKYDSDLPFYTGIKNVNVEENKARYALYLQDGLMLSDDWPDARIHADRLFEDAHTVTNINGYKEMQVGGIASTTKNQIDLDLSTLRENFVKLPAVKDTNYLITKDDGSSDIGTIGLEGTTFENPREVFGETEYMVYSYGNPVVGIDTGQQLTVSYDDTDIQELIVQQSKTLEQQRYRTGQIQIQKEIDALTAKVRRGEKRGIDMAPERQQLQGLESGMMAKAKAFRDSQ